MKEAEDAFLLLADPSPNLRRLALIEIFGKSEDDPEVQELESLRDADPPAAELFSSQKPDGSWSLEALGSSAILATAAALARLGLLGFGPGCAAVRRGADFLFSKQRKDGSWPLGGEIEGEELDASEEGYAIIPLQASLPLRGLAACGYASDPRAERAYSWLIGKRLEDGTWPTGWAKSGVYGRVAGYRRLPHSRWGCRTNTTAALVCLAGHPARKKGGEAAAGLDQILGRETRDRFALGFETARILGAERSRGRFTFYAPFDLALSLRLCVEIGAPLSDPRVAELIAYIREARGEFGLWEYRGKPQASRWVSFDILRSLSRLRDENPEWRGAEPRTPFSPYPKREKRY